jgi:hypothetical protein
MPQEFSRLARLATLLAGFTVLAACGGGGGSGLGDAGGDPNPPGGGAQVTVSGKITFDRLVFSTTPGEGLNAASPVESPAREVVVQAMSGSLALATTTTNANGDYSLTVPASRSMFIRARAQMQKTDAAPTWSFTVRDNTDSDAIWALDGSPFNSGTTAVTRNLRATSGWGGSSYTGTRAAAPFAILDTVYRTKELIRGASANERFPELNLYWSTTNRNVVDEDGDPVFCPDDGAIGTSFYFSDASGTTTDGCSPAAVLPDGMYILGAFDSDEADTDEFDQHVIAHEFGHYFEDRFSRSDSIGGQHTTNDQLDLRVAFGEGWGNAFGAMALNDPLYRDSSGGVSEDFNFNLETGAGTGTVTGWFSEGSVGKFLWDVFDTSAESGDNVALGFTPIFNVMTDEEVNTPAMTSIFSFAAALRANNGSASANIQNLLQAEGVTGIGEFGAGESNDGGDVGFTDVYTDIAAGIPATGICSTNGTPDGNKLGNRRFLRYVKPTSGLVNIQATGAVAAGVLGSNMAADPDIQVYQQGTLRSGTQGRSGNPNQETITSLQLAAGTHVIEVVAYETIDPDAMAVVTTPRCMNVTIQEL